ncbi:MAG TPA: methyltransferase domain-containing protein [Acidimicrobiales bacterium]
MTDSTERDPGDIAERAAGGFADVDGSGDPGYHIRYLDRVRSGGNWPRWKAESVDAMELPVGGRGLDLGCGTGEEVEAIARRVGTAGTAIGVDRSLVMLTEAARRQPDGTFLAADANALPFPAGAFAACRIERTLQHLTDPARCLRELARVLQPGGMLVAFEPDWDTLVTSSPLDDVTRALNGFRRGENPSRRVGSQLTSLMVDAGLVVTAARAVSVLITSYVVAEVGFSLEASCRRAVEAGAVSADEGAAWLASLRQLDAGGAFLASVTNVNAVARKPTGPRGPVTTRIASLEHRPVG